MILFIVGACSKEEKGKDYVQQEFKIAAINVCGDTENADILLLCNDGCYILCDAENKDGYSVIYINESVDNNFENGLTAFLDNSGTPVMDIIFSKMLKMTDLILHLSIIRTKYLIIMTSN